MSTDDVIMADAEGDADAGELLVWPWTGILAMTAADEDADAATTLASHAHRLFAGVTTTALQEEPQSTNHQHRREHFLLLHFGKSWTGLRDAMSVAFHFARAGRREWRRRREGGSKEGAAGVFGWAAAEEDLLGDGTVGRFLRESGAVARSVEDVEKDKASNAAKLGDVAASLEVRETDLKAKNEEMVRKVQRMQEENISLDLDLKDLKAIADNSLSEMNNDAEEENKKLRAELDAINEKIKFTVDRIQELKECKTDLHCSKVEKLVIEINSLDMANVRPKTSDHAQMLHDEHKEEMDVINTKIIQLEMQLGQKEALESAICLLNTKLKAEANLKMEEYGHLLMTNWKERLEKNREIFQNAYVDLARRDHLNRNELQETRQELIKCLEGMMIKDRTVVGIKKMGQLDEMPFHDACKRKHEADDPEGKAARLVSRWKEELKNISRNPFTTILVDGEEKDIVNEDDPKLRQLWTEYGDNVCNAVKVTLRELNEYSPQGRHAVNELWNFKEGRKATTGEVVKYIFKQLKTSS